MVALAKIVAGVERQARALPGGEGRVHGTGVEPHGVAHRAQGGLGIGRQIDPDDNGLVRDQGGQLGEGDRRRRAVGMERPGSGSPSGTPSAPPATAPSTLMVPSADGGTSPSTPAAGTRRSPTRTRPASPTVGG